MRIEPIANNLGYPWRTALQQTPKPAVDVAHDPLFENYDRKAASGDPYRLVDRMLDLSRGGRNPISPLEQLDGEGLQTFIDMTATLLQHGVVGYELLEIDKQPYTSFVTNRIGDPRLQGAQFYRRRPEPFDARI